MVNPRETWPGGASVAVMITVAFEYWAPGHWPVYAPMASSWPIGGEITDQHSISWSEYGARAGVWRLLDILQSHAIQATFPTSALAVQRDPETVHAISMEGHEIAGHSTSQDVLLPNLTPEAESDLILQCGEDFAELTGAHPTGWLSPRATASPQTLELLARAGYLWSGDHNDGELPRVVPTSSGPIVAIMHSDISDVRAAAAGPAALRDAHRATLDYLLTTGNREILNITVHTHVSGRPLLAAAFDSTLGHIRSHGDRVRIATHDEIARWTLEEHTSTRSSR